MWLVTVGMVGIIFCLYDAFSPYHETTACIKLMGIILQSCHIRVTLIYTVCLMAYFKSLSKHEGREREREREREDTATILSQQKDEARLVNNL